MTPDNEPLPDSSPDQQQPLKPQMKVFGSPNVVEEPESTVPNRSDWKLMMLASTAFLVLSIGLAAATGGRRVSADFEQAATVPFIGFLICFLYGFWKLMRIPDRTGKEESLLGFLTILAFTPVCLTIFSIVGSMLPGVFLASVSLPMLALPFALVVVVKRQTSRPSARGNFAGGVGLGCGALFLLSALGIALVCGFIR